MFAEDKTKTDTKDNDENNGNDSDEETASNSGKKTPRDTLTGRSFLKKFFFEVLLWIIFHGLGLFGFQGQKHPLADLMNESDLELSSEDEQSVEKNMSGTQTPRFMSRHISYMQEDG